MPTPAQALAQEMATRPAALNQEQARRAFALLLVNFMFPATTLTEARRTAEWVVSGVPQ